MSAAHALARNGIAYRISREFRDGQVVNLGAGMPALSSQFVDEDTDVLLHSEHGVVGFGRRARTADEVDVYLITAGRAPVTPRPGMCVMDHAESFALIRGGRLDISVLGALQVSAGGDLANCWLPGAPAGSIGGAQDLAFCAQRVIVAMTLRPRPDRLVNRLSLTMTAPGCVDRLVTDVGVIDLEGGHAVVRELAPGWTLGEVQALTEVDLEPAPGGVRELAVPAERAEFWTD